MALSDYTGKLPVGILTRVSDQGTRSDEELISHDIQRTKVEAYLTGADIAYSGEEFKDNNRSGGKMDRPALNRALKACRDGKLGGIAVYHLSRLGRTTREVLDVIYELNALECEVVCLTPRIDTSTPEGRAMLTVFLAFYTLEREQAITKAGDTAEFKLSKGQRLGGRAPAGYTSEWKQAESFETVQGIRLDFAGGKLKTAYAVAAALNEAGILTSHGGSWNQRNVLSFLRNPNYTGVYHYAGKAYADITHPAMHDGDVQRVIERKVAPKTERKAYVRGEGHVLGAGLLRCSECGAGMVQSVGNGTATLRCSSGLKGHASISYAPAQAWIEQFAFSAAALGNDAPEYEGVVQAIRSREALVAAVAEALAAVEQAAETLGVTVEELPASAPVVQALAKAQDAVTEYDLSSEADGSSAYITRAEYDALDVKGQREALHALIAEVVVTKGRQGQRIANVALYDRLTIKFRNGTQVPAAPEADTPNLTVVTGGAVATETGAEAASVAV